MTTFADLGLSPEVLRAVAETGYDTATPIQEQAIPVALAGGDVLGIAQTGTGKTAAFTLPMIERLAAGRSKARMPRSLVLAPTRELADQVSASFEKYAKYYKLSWALLIGGVSFEDQNAKLDRGVDVLIATPGRLLDHFERGRLLLNGVQIMVVDEADRMLDMGFIPDIERIFKMTPANKQTLFFSATMPPEITRLTTQFLRNPTRIEASRPATTNENIQQYVVHIPRADPKAKRVALRALVGRDDVKNGIVFCNRKTDVDIVSKSLRAHGYDAAAIHGDLDQNLRMKTLDDFRKDRLKLLCASDVAARGLDIPDVSHVFNYDVPHHADDYVHRIGRTGRAGRSGQTFMLVTPADARNYDKVIKLTKSVPAEVVLDIDWTAVEVDERPARGGKTDRARGGRDRGGARGGGERSAPDRNRPAKPVPDAEVPDRTVAERGRSRRPRAETPLTSPETTSTVSPEAAALVERPAGDRSPSAAQPARGRRPARSQATETTPGQASVAHAKSVEAERAPRGKARAEGADLAAVGFGSETPAFLLRPVALKKVAEAD